MPPDDEVRRLTGEIVAVGRRRWPGARFASVGAAVRWTDGPARPDLRAVLAEGGITCAHLEQHGIRLERCFSPRVVATIALATTDLPVRDAHRVADELTTFPIPAQGPPPLLADPELLACWWRRAGHLLAYDQPRRRVAVDRDRALHGAVLRARWLARALGPAALDAGPTPAWTPADAFDTSTLVPDDGWGPRLVLPLRLPGCPDLDIVAVLPPVPSGEPGDVGPPPEAELRWVDGPAPSHVLGLLRDTHSPSPLGGCGTVTTARRLSAVGVAAAVLLHQRIHGRAYRDPTASAHPMQRWKVASVRDAERRGRQRRLLLEDLQAQLLLSPLPPAGDLTIRTPGRNGRDLVVDGPQLWARAEALLTITQDRDHDHRTAYRPGSDPSRRLAVTLARELEHTGERTLATMCLDGHRTTVSGRTGDDSC